MNVEETQRVAIFQNNKPVGLVTSKLDKPAALGGNIITMGWHGICLGEEIHAGGISEVYKQARKIAAERGLRKIFIGDGTDVDTLYTPATEE